MKKDIIILVLLVVALMIATLVFSNLKNHTSIKGQNFVPHEVKSTSTNKGYDVVVKSNGEKIIVWKTPQEPVEKEIYLISGNYSETERYYRSNWDNQPDQKYTCDSFVVLSGDEDLIGKYKQLIKDGNTINHLDENGRLVLNLDLKYIPQDLATKIISSSGEILLNVTEKEEGGGEGGPCYSVVNVNSVR